MNLLVIKPLTYISPSTFLTWGKCQNRVYQGKMAGHPFIKRQSTKAAAIGIVFDAFIKHAILSRRKESFPETKSLSYIFDKLKEQLVEGLDIDKICREGRALATAFIKQKFIDRFVNLDNKVLLDVEVYRICDGVPLLGIIDIIINNMPVDLKTRGFGKDTKTYSHGGYAEKITKDGIVKFGEHKPLEDVSSDWATQLYFYATIIQTKPLLKGEIIEVCNQSGGHFETAFHATNFTIDFITETRQKITDMWASVSGLTANIKEPVPGWQCREYGILCEVANKCPKFMAELSADVGANS